MITDYLRIHAAALVFAPGAVMICGPNGAGKTTLTLALVQKGARVLSDDETWIDPCSCLLHPSERPLLIKDSGLHHFPEYSRLAVRVDNEDEIIWLLSPENIRVDLRGQPSPCRAIISLRPGSGGMPTIRMIHQHEAFCRLLEQCMNFPAFGREAVTVMSRLVQSSVLFELSQGDLEMSVRLIKEEVLCPMSR